MMGLMMTMAAAALAAQPMTAPGPQGPLAGTFENAEKGAPIVLIVPGSGPTDRDGNNPLGVKGGPYAQLAGALKANGVSSVRIDKRGLFGSKAAIADPNKVTIADYASDVHSWVDSIRQQTGARCVWVLGHSEGGLVALAAAQQPDHICGLVLVSAPGRPMGQIIRDQLRSNPANAPVLDSAFEAIDALEQGKHVDTAEMHPALQRLFAPQVQDFLIDAFKRDPARMIAALTMPVMIIQGDHDVQVALADAKALAAAQPKAKLLLVPGMNHVLRDVATDDRAANLATYGDADAKIDPTVAPAIAAFVKK